MKLILRPTVEKVAKTDGLMFASASIHGSRDVLKARL